MAKVRKHNYVVGYPDEGCCIYGKEYGRRIRDKWTIAHPMTLHQANSMLKDLRDSPKVIFKLVPVVTVTKPKKKPK